MKLKDFNNTLLFSLLFYETIKYETNLENNARLFVAIGATCLYMISQFCWNQMEK